MLSMSHILLLLIVVLIVFGAGKLPKVMEDLGKGMKSFKKAVNEDETKTDTDKKDE